MSGEYRNSNTNAPAVGNVASRQQGSEDQYENNGASKHGPGVGNYPQEDHTTSSGGYGSANVWSDRAQRGNPDTNFSGNFARTEIQPSGGLIDQSLNGTNLKSGLADAKQGIDEDTRRDVEPTNPYGKGSLDSSSDTRKHLADAFADP